jgi:hypothetical protein
MPRTPSYAVWPSKEELHVDGSAPITAAVSTCDDTDSCFKVNPADWLVEPAGLTPRTPICAVVAAPYNTSPGAPIDELAVPPNVVEEKEAACERALALLSKL